MIFGARPEKRAGSKGRFRWRKHVGGHAAWAGGARAAANPERFTADERGLIVLSRVLAAARELVFRAWIEKERFVQWFGPRGFTTEIKEADMWVGGRLRFDLGAPDGKVYDNRIVFL